MHTRTPWTLLTLLGLTAGCAPVPDGGPCGITGAPKEDVVDLHDVGTSADNRAALQLQVVRPDCSRGPVMNLVWDGQAEVVAVDPMVEDAPPLGDGVRVLDESETSDVATYRWDTLGIDASVAPRLRVPRLQVTFTRADAVRRLQCEAQGSKLHCTPQTQD